MKVKSCLNEGGDPVKQIGDDRNERKIMKRMKQSGMKRVMTVIAAAAISLSMVGCGGKASAAEGTTEVVSDISTEVPETPTGDAPSSEASSEKAEGTEVMAKITSINGEALTVEAFPNMGGQTDGKGGPGQDGGKGGAPSGEAPTDAAPTGEAPEAPTGEAPVGNKDGKGGQPGGEKPSGEAPSGETLELTLTSETEYNDCSADDLEEGTMVRITYDENNEVVSISVETQGEAPADAPQQN